MKHKTPDDVQFLGVLIILNGCVVGVVSFILFAGSPGVFTDEMHFGILFSMVIFFLIGGGLFAGKNWARIAFLWMISLNIILGLLNRRIPIVPLFMHIAAAIYLLQPEIRDFFRGYDRFDVGMDESACEDPEDVWSCLHCYSLNRNTASICSICKHAR